MNTPQPQQLINMETTSFLKSTVLINVEHIRVDIDCIVGVGVGGFGDMMLSHSSSLTCTQMWPLPGLPRRPARSRQAGQLRACRERWP